MKEALPQIQIPGGFPAWLVSNHSSVDDDIYATVEMSSGHDRLRRIYSVTPQRRKVSMLLTQAQGAEFFSWFENDLIGGVLRFAAKVRALGPDHLWYGAVFASSPPYTAEMAHWGRTEVHWLIEAELLLFGAGSEYGPALTSFEGAVSIPLLASATKRAGTWGMVGNVDVPLITIAGKVDLSGNVGISLDSQVVPITGLPFIGNADVPLIGAASATRTTLFYGNVGVPLNGHVN